jgi:hypothetical protein
MFVTPTQGILRKKLAKVMMIYIPSRLANPFVGLDSCMSVSYIPSRYSASDTIVVPVNSPGTPRLASKTRRKDAEPICFYVTQISLICLIPRSGAFNPHQGGAVALAYGDHVPFNACADT